VEHAVAPPLGNAREVGHRVLHAGREQHAAAAHHVAAGEPGGERSVAGTLQRDDRLASHLHARVVPELRVRRGVEVVGRGALLREQPADRVGGTVALVPGVEQQHVLARAPEHERAAQSGSATPDDETVM
jgi:hypothetical protein